MKIIGMLCVMPTNQVDNLYRHSQKVKESFLDSVPKRENLMSPSEINYLESLPDQITIYRGASEVEMKQKSYGVSWDT